jgi:hypothetical protein
MTFCSLAHLPASARTKKEHWRHYQRPEKAARLDSPEPGIKAIHRKSVLQVKTLTTIKR